MSTKFENIFEKFKINCKVPNKSRKFVHHRKKSFKFDKHLLRLPLDKDSTSQKSASCERNACKESKTIGNSTPLHFHSINGNNANNFRPQAVLNESKESRSLRDKYCNSLETGNVLENHHRANESSNDSFKFSNEFDGSLCERKISHYSYSGQDSGGLIKKLPLTCSFNLKNTAHRRRKCTKLSQYKPLDISVIPKRHNTSFTVNNTLESEESTFNSTPLTDFKETRGELFTPFLSSSPKSIQSRDKSDRNLTELDLLIDLVKRDERPKKNNENKKKEQNTRQSDALNIINMEQFSPCLSSSPKPTQFIESSASTPKLDDKNPTELDLLIDLIERDERTKTINEKKKEKKSKSKALNGGFEDLFQRALTLETTKCRFLDYDRKFGVHSGQLLKVVGVDTFYGATFAIVESNISSKPFGIVISAAMLSLIKIGSKLEAFFDDHTMPYKLEINNNVLDIYLEPFKVLVL